MQHARPSQEKLLDACRRPITSPSGKRIHYGGKRGIKRDRRACACAAKRAERDHPGKVRKGFYPLHSRGSTEESSQVGLGLRPRDFLIHLSKTQG